MKHFMLKWFILLTLEFKIYCVSLDDDPSLWPGHMEPFGSKQKGVNVEELNEWPSPKEFFQNYIDKSQPVLLKGLAKRSPAYTLWDDDYIRDRPGSDTYLVYVEPEKKENRTKHGREITLKSFIEIYQKDSIYMVHGVPKHIQKDVIMPAPLRCEETKKYLRDAVTWFSSGGTKSVVHHDDLDNVNCLIRGTKKLLFVNYEKYGKYLPLDKGGYSSIDVEKVNYTKFPDLRNIEYVHADMEEGDCLFIPFKWIHQVNSKANEKGQNIAVNIWFKHAKKHRPEKCEISVKDATLDKYRFIDLEKAQTSIENNSEEDKNEMDSESVASTVDKFEEYLLQTKKNRANFKMFYQLLLKDKDFIEPFSEEEEEEEEEVDVVFPKEFEAVVKKLFDVLDITKNGILNVKDFDLAEHEDNIEEFEENVNIARSEVLKYLKTYWNEQKNKKSSGDASVQDKKVEL